jgi:uncharacterized protein YyaL (SSP411 family)
MLCALDQALDTPRQVVLAGSAAGGALRPFHDVLRATFLPNTVVAVADAGGPEVAVAAAVAGPGVAADAVPLLTGKTMVGGRPAAYVCEGGACKPPVTSPEEMRRLL